MPYYFYMLAIKAKARRLLFFLMVVGTCSSSLALDPLATDLPYEAMPRKIKAIRLIQSTLFVKSHSPRLGLGLGWSPILTSSMDQLFRFELSSTFYQSTNSVSGSPVPSLFSTHMSFQIQNRISEAFAFETTFGMSHWMATGQGMFDNSADRSSPGLHFGFRLIDYFLPPPGGYLESWSLGVLTDATLKGRFSVQLDVSVGFNF